MSDTAPTPNPGDFACDCGLVAPLPLVASDCSCGRRWFRIGNSLWRTPPVEPPPPTPTVERVTGCATCPLLEHMEGMDGSIFWACRHPADTDEGNGEAGMPPAEAPPWCPLRTRPLTLEWVP